MGSYEIRLLLKKLEKENFLTTEEVVKYLEKFLKIYNYIFIEKYLYSYNDNNMFLVQFVNNSNYCAMNSTEIKNTTLSFYIKDLKVVNVTKNEIKNITSVLF
jgi:hypothetical protein